MEKCGNEGTGVMDTMLKKLRFMSLGQQSEGLNRREGLENEVERGAVGESLDCVFQSNNSFNSAPFSSCCFFAPNRLVLHVGATLPRFRPFSLSYPASLPSPHIFTSTHTRYNH